MYKLYLFNQTCYSFKALFACKDLDQFRPFYRRCIKLGRAKNSDPQSFCCEKIAGKKADIFY